MNDLENKNKDTSPFQGDPFSVDVWERAYKNVGRPFENTGFDSAPDLDNSKSSTPIPTKDLTSSKAVGTAQAPKKKDMEGYRAAERSRASQPTSTLTVTPPTYSAPSHQAPNSTHQKHHINTQSSSKQKEDDKPTDFFNMLENAFNGDISDALKNVGNLVKNSFGNSKKHAYMATNAALVIIVFVIILIFVIMVNA